MRNTYTIFLRMRFFEKRIQKKVIAKKKIVGRNSPPPLVLEGLTKPRHRLYRILITLYLSHIYCAKITFFSEMYNSYKSLHFVKKIFWAWPPSVFSTLWKHLWMSVLILPWMTCHFVLQSSIRPIFIFSKYLKCGYFKHYPNHTFYLFCDKMNCISCTNVFTIILYPFKASIQFLA